MMTKWMAKGYLWLLLVLLYSPILIIMIFSFTEAKVLGNWTGFSTRPAPTANSTDFSRMAGSVYRRRAAFVGECVVEYVRHCDDRGDRLHAVG